MKRTKSKKIKEKDQEGRRVSIIQASSITNDGVPGGGQEVVSEKEGGSETDKYNSRSSEDSVPRKRCKPNYFQSGSSTTQTFSAKSPESSSEPQKSVKKTIKHGEVFEDGQDSVEEVNSGKLVWANFSGERWWPGMVFAGGQIRRKTKPKMSWIFWFGDHKVSQILHRKIIPFQENFCQKYSTFKSHMFAVGVWEALEICAERCGKNNDTMSENDLISWAREGFKGGKSSKDITCLDYSQNEQLPTLVAQNLKRLYDLVKDRPLPKAKETISDPEASLQAKKKMQGKAHVTVMDLKSQGDLSQTDDTEQENADELDVFEADVEPKEAVIDESQPIKSPKIASERMNHTIKLADKGNESIDEQTERYNANISNKEYDQVIMGDETEENKNFDEQAVDFEAMIDKSLSTKVSKRASVQMKSIIKPHHKGKENTDKLAKRRSVENSDAKSDLLNGKNKIVIEESMDVFEFFEINEAIVDESKPTQSPKRSPDQMKYTNKFNMSDENIHLSDADSGEESEIDVEDLGKFCTKKEATMESDELIISSPDCWSRKRTKPDFFQAGLQSNKASRTVKTDSFQEKFLKQILKDHDVGAEDQEIIEEFSPGKLVWANYSGERWWPGMLISGDKISMRTKPRMAWVFWFGDHKVSQISHSKIIPFQENYHLKVTSAKSKMLRNGVLEALKILAERCEKNVKKFMDDDLFTWARDGFEGEKPSKNTADHCLPDFITKNLQKINDQVMNRYEDITGTVDKDSSDNKEKINNFDVNEDIETREALSDFLNDVREGQRKIQDFCIACDKPNENVTCQHPFHEGGLCLDCKERFIENLFAVGDDSIYVYCTLCQNGGQLFVCESMTCQRVYCLPCIELFINKNAIERVKMTDPWFCFECTQYTEETHGLIIPKDEWQQNVIRLYDTGYRIQPPDLSYFLTGKKAMRVLSLFDGIGTAKLALNELNIAVESFFSSEVDADALLVSSVNHGIDIIQIGDITKLTDAQINRICPIDLVIGGSPCNEFSIANPARKAFDMDTTGVLFFDFCRVLEIVQRRNKERYVFWLYENVASMKSVVREVFNRFLGCEPALWDAKYFSAQSRARFFWGNIPGMYSTPDLRQLASPASLNTVLSPYCHRRATVERLRCVTTRSNSLRLGKDDKGFPIKMNGKECSIWIPELERLFGFPAHYTDVANLPTTRRQKLLGRAWSVPVIKHLLTPLKHYFASRKPE